MEKGGNNLTIINTDHTVRDNQNINHKVEKPIFMRLRGPKVLDDRGHEGTQRKHIEKTNSPRRRGGVLTFPGFLGWS